MDKNPNKVQHQGMANLRHFTAPDTAGGTEAMSAKIPIEMLAAFDVAIAQHGANRGLVVRALLTSFNNLDSPKQAAMINDYIAGIKRSAQ